MRIDAPEGTAASLFSLVALLSQVAVGQWATPCGQEGVTDWIMDRFREGCTSKWIKNDISDLRHQLNNRLFGQHLAAKSILTAIKGHLDNRDPPKALTLSFHGWTGIGKTYTSDLIARSLYVEGMNSKFVKRFYGQTDFPHRELTKYYAEQVRKAINDCVSQCCQCLFIFDEIDKMPPGIFDTFKGYFDHYSSVHGLNYRRSIFLFISNIGSKRLADMMVSRWEKGHRRESLELQDIEPYLKDAVYNTDGGLQHSSLIEHNLLGTFVPFLPLEREHVKQCIRALGGHRASNSHKVDMVAERLSYYPEDLQLFARTGCTSVMEKLYHHDEF